MMGFEPVVRNAETKDMDGQLYKLLTIGKRSYITGIVAEILPQPSNHILIGDYTAIGHDVKMQINTQHDYSLPSIFPWNNPYSPVFPCKMDGNARCQIVVGHDVWIGRGAVISGGIRIGDGAVVAANAVVTKDVEPYTIVGGNPAHIIRYRFDKGTIRRMREIRWWEWPEEKIIAEKKWMLESAEAFSRHFIAGAEADEAPIMDEMVQKAMPSGYKKYLYIMDEMEKVPVGGKVVADFLQSYTNGEKVCLILLGDFQQKPQVREQVEAFVKGQQYDRAPLITLLEKSVGINEGLLRSVDVFVTNKQYDMLDWLNACDRYGIPFVSGVDTWSFGQKSHVHQPFLF